MEIMNPCAKCGGIPFVAPYKDTLSDSGLYIVRCMRCGNVGTLEYTEKEALEKWNKKNILRTGGTE